MPQQHGQASGAVSLSQALPGVGRAVAEVLDPNILATALALLPAQGRGYRSSPQVSPRSITVPPTAAEGFLSHLNNGLISAPLFKIAPFLSPSKSVKALSRVLWGLGGGIIYIK